MNEPYLERRLQVIERQQERHSEEISAMRVIQAEQQALMRAFSDQRVEDRLAAREDRKTLIALQEEDRKALVLLQGQANRFRGILMAVVVVMTLIGPLINQGVRYVLFGHPPSEGKQGLIRE